METQDKENMLTVIIPNYNHAPYLKERIESVLNQLYQDFEVIILDDCSSDNSREIIEQYRNHPKVSHIVFNEVNSGSTFKQWQKGISLAKGEYIWIAESDDVAHPEFLKSIMVEMEKDNEIVLGFSAIQGIDSDGNKIPGYTLSTYTHTTVMDGMEFIKKNMVFGCHILNASSVVFKKEIAYKIPKDYMSLKTAGDYLFWIEIASKGKVVKVPKKLDYFRQHERKVTPNAVKTGLQFEEVFKIFQILDSRNLLKPMHRKLAIGFWMDRVKKEKSKFQSSQILNKIYDLWKVSKTKRGYYRLLYIINGVGRKLKKKYLGYSI